MSEAKYLIDDGILTVVKDGETRVFEIDTSTPEITMSEIDKLKQEGEI